MMTATKVYYDRSEENAEHARRLKQSENRSQDRLFELLVSQGRATRFSHQVRQRFEGLRSFHEAADIGHALKLPPERFDQLRDAAIACMALPDMEPAGPAIHAPEGTIAFACDAAMTRYAVRLRDGTILVRGMDDDNEISRFKAPGDRDDWVFELSPDGRYLCSGNHASKEVVVWDVQRKTECLRDAVHEHFRVTRFSPDSRMIAIGSVDGSVAIYDLSPNLRSRRWAGWGPVRHIAFRPDGLEIAVVYGGSRPSCRILDAETGRQVRPITMSSVAAVEWSPDGRSLVVAGDDSKVTLWIAATGERSAVIEGFKSENVHAGFHPSGSLLASNGWDNRLRLWDAVQGRPILSLMGGCNVREFSRDGRLFLHRGDEWRPWRLEPALEYTTLAHAAGSPLNYARPSIHRDGRIVTVGTDRGVVLWDLETRAELAFLPIGQAWHSAFSATGDLLTNGQAGFLRWPVRVDRTTGEFRIGPPRKLPLPGTDCSIDEDREGRTITVAASSAAYVLLGDRPMKIGPLEDCRGAYVSPGGEWLATGSHTVAGVTIWKLPEGSKVTSLPTNSSTHAKFSPDGRWLVTDEADGQLFEVGTWRRVGQLAGRFLCFSPDGRLAVVVDASNVLLLVQLETGRVLARIESPDVHPIGWAAFNADGSRLVETSNNPPGARVWDLRTIRRHLRVVGLDWDAPPLPPARSSTRDGERPALELEVDFGSLKNVVENRKRHLAQDGVPAEELIASLTEWLNTSPEDAESLHQRGHAFLRSRRLEEALADFTAASSMRPRDAHLHAYRGASLFNLQRYALALDQLEQAVLIDPESVRAIMNLDTLLNNVAWPMAGRDPELAARLAAFAVALAPDEQTSLNTLGVALYRSGRWSSAIETLERSLAAAHGQFDGFDLFFLAMAHHRMGHRAEARACFDRAVRWVSEHKSLNPRHLTELAEFRAEAESVLSGPAGEMPDNVFGGPGL
jgi:WD40 repeat protein/tetratricopeptide (TPR) repeat protein